MYNGISGEDLGHKNKVQEYEPGNSGDNSNAPAAAGAGKTGPAVSAFDCSVRDEAIRQTFVQAHCTLARYFEGLRQLAPTAAATGFMMGVWNDLRSGLLASLPRTEAADRLRLRWPTEMRLPDDDAILGLVARMVEGGTESLEPGVHPGMPVVGRWARDAIVRAGLYYELDDVMGQTLVRPRLTSLLETLYGTHEYVSIGEHQRWQTRRVGEWLADISKGKPIGPFITVNPCLGSPDECDGDRGHIDGRPDESVVHRYVAVTCDGISCFSQFKFWAAAGLPLTALVFDGVDQMYAWLRVDALPRSPSQARDAAREMEAQFKPLGLTVRSYSRLPTQRERRCEYLPELLYVNPLARW